MCGIVAFIGKAQNPEVAHALTTALLVQTETRGDDAAGFWATEDKETDTSLVYFSKEPIRASQFVNLEMWKSWNKKPINLFIGHCRKSTCRGSENINRNNHPFLSKDGRRALVHNGNVPEFDALRSNYEVESDCDSEILLRMVEHGERYPESYVREQLRQLRVKGNDTRTIDSLAPEDSLPRFAQRLIGLRDVFARINYGAMAVAIGERWPDGTRALWLWRDKDRPLHVIDMRKTLGQIYVVSEKSIWRKAVESTPSAKPFVKGNTAIIEFPQMFIWLLTVSPKGRFGVRKWRVNRVRNLKTTFEKDRPLPVEVENTLKPVRIVTNLNHETHEVDTKNFNKAGVIITKGKNETLDTKNTGKALEPPPTTTNGAQKKTEIATSSKSITANNTSLTNSTMPVGPLSESDPPFEIEECVPNGNNLTHPKLEVIRHPISPIFADDEEESSGEIEDLTHQQIPLGVPSSTKLIMTRNTSIDQAEIEQFRNVIDRMRKMLEEIETSVDQNLADDSISLIELQTITSGLEDLASDMNSQTFSIVKNSAFIGMS